MTRTQAGKGAAIAQMNLPLIESKPVMLPSDKQRELAIALADLLLAAAIRSRNPTAEIGNESENFTGSLEAAGHRVHPAISHRASAAQPGEPATAIRTCRSRTPARFQSVEVIDEDLGRSGSGQVERPGFEHLVAEVCTGQVGAVLCIEASRLARNGRDWHHLIELCGLVRAIVIDPDGVYDPCILNDRLLAWTQGNDE